MAGGYLLFSPRISFLFLNNKKNMKKKKLKKKSTNIVHISKVFILICCGRNTHFQMLSGANGLLSSPHNFLTPIQEYILWFSYSPKNKT